MTIRNILKWAGLALVLLLAIVLLINAFDERLNPSIAKFKDVGASKIPKEQNAYFAMIGFAAAAEGDPHERGVLIVKAYEEAIAVDSLAFEYKPHSGNGPLSISGPVNDLCRPKGKSDCLSRSQKMERTIRAMQSDNAVLLQRYRSLYDYRYFRTAAIYGMSTPTIELSTIGNTHALLLSGLALEVSEDNAKFALERLAVDCRFWRRMLGQSSNLVDKMVAGGLLKQDLTFLSEIIRVTQLSEPGLVAAGAIAAPLDSQERDFTMVFAGEFAMTAHVLSNVGSAITETPANDFTRWLDQAGTRLFYERNATLNALYAYARESIDIASLPAPDFMKVWKEGLQERPTGRRHSWVSYIYNPVGKSLFDTLFGATAYWMDYVARIHDLDGLIRLVSLQLAIKRDQIEGPRIESFLQGADVEYTNPYTGKPMQWDSVQRSIYFEREDGQGETKRIEVFL